MSTKKKPIMIAVSVLVVALLGGGGYFAYLKLQEQTDKNTKDLASAGDVLVGDAYTPNPDENTEVESSTFDTSATTTPSRKIVNALQQDNVKLNVTILSLQQEVTDLRAQVAELENYKQVNERFAPKSIKAEVADIENQIKAFLLENEDAERFSVSQIEIMSAASAVEYKEFVTRNRLMMSEQQKTRVAIEFLPGYAFCVGDGIALAANNSAEFDLIAEKFRGVASFELPKALERDLESVMVPCQNSLRAQLDKDLQEQDSSVERA